MMGFMRYGDRYCLLCRSGTDPVSGGPRYYNVEH